VAVDFEKIKGLSAYTAEFGVLVEDYGVAEAISQLYFHNCRGESGGIGTGDRLQCAKGAHTAAHDEVELGSFKTGMGASHVRIDMQY
jgi:hypothetical protein